jgi:hypothetical protein
MSTVEEIKAAIDHLSPPERARLESLLAQEDDAWDRQMAADAKAGKLNRLIAEADADIEAGRLREFP